MEYNPSTAQEEDKDPGQQRNMSVTGFLQGCNEWGLYREVKKMVLLSGDMKKDNFTN